MEHSASTHPTHSRPERSTEEMSAALLKRMHEEDKKAKTGCKTLSQSSKRRKTAEGIALASTDSDLDEEQRASLDPERTREETPSSAAGAKPSGKPIVNARDIAKMEESNRNGEFLQQAASSSKTGTPSRFIPLDTLHSVFAYCHLHELVHLSAVSRDWRHAAYSTPLLQVCRLSTRIPSKQQLKQALQAISRLARRYTVPSKAYAIGRLRAGLEMHKISAVGAAVLAMMESAEVTKQEGEIEGRECRAIVYIRVQLPAATNSISESPTYQELQVLCSSASADIEWHVRIGETDWLLLFHKEGVTRIRVMIEVQMLVDWMRTQSLLVGDPHDQFWVLILTIRFLYEWVSDGLQIHQFLANNGGPACASAVGFRFPDSLVDRDVAALFGEPESSADSDGELQEDSEESNLSDEE